MGEDADHNWSHWMELERTPIDGGEQVVEMKFCRLCGERRWRAIEVVASGG